MSKTVTTTYSTNILGLLGVAFVVLKLTGYIDWSWWWVTAPFWGGLALFACVAGVALLVALFVMALGWLAEKNGK